MKESISPFQIRLHLLEIAERILLQNKCWEADSANWKANNQADDLRRTGQSTSGVTLELPRLSMQELVQAAAELRQFVDNRVEPQTINITNTLNVEPNGKVEIKPEFKPPTDEEVEANWNALMSGLMLSDHEQALLRLFAEKQVIRIEYAGVQTVAYGRNGSTTNLTGMSQDVIQKCWSLWRTTKEFDRMKRLQSEAGARLNFKKESK